MLRTHLSKERILINPDISTKTELFELISKDAEANNLCSSADAMFSGLTEREEQLSTEMEKGLAIPHIKSDVIPNLFVYAVISEKGIKWGGFGSKVKIAFLIGSPKVAEHFLDTMATIARLLNKSDICDELLRCRTSESVMQFIDQTNKIDKISVSGTKNLLGIFIVLHDTDKVDEAMRLAIEIGIKGITLFDTTNVAAKIALNFPFLSFFAARNDQISSVTIFGVIENDSMTNRLYAHLKKEGIDMREPGSGIIFSFPLGTVFGGIDADYI